MAGLFIQAEASEGVKPPTPILAIDGWVIHLIDGEGHVQIAGSRGDGSTHTLSYDIRGQEGATLKVTISCGGETLRELEIEIYAGTNANAGIAEFDL